MKACLERVRERVGGNWRHKSVYVLKGFCCKRKKRKGVLPEVEVRPGEEFLNGRNNVFVCCISSPLALSNQVPQT